MANFSRNVAKGWMEKNKRSMNEVQTDFVSDMHKRISTTLTF
jgi:hypothetical protein